MEALNVHNYMENLIKNKMEDVYKAMPDICRCERCDMDRLAYALNNSPPKYIVTSRGKLYAKLAALQEQFDADIVRVITTAAVRIDQSPRCQEEEDLNS
ncbi:MAG: late competence development ComFB family protein [Defluviitaleaceae bacterium]|nr:late competence development ComFB family protein [Defluviitaleaceae bacterium]